MDEAELSLTLGSNWLAQARERDPEGYLESAWRLYANSPNEVLESALLAELSRDVGLATLELRAESERARAISPQDLLRSGLLAAQLALSSLPHLDWAEVRLEAWRWPRERCDGGWSGRENDSSLADAGATMRLGVGPTG